MKEKLIQYNRYSRQQIHDMFSPDTPFKKGTGLWGVSGIIAVPNTTSDYIFYVTYGSSQSGQEFKESIDENGILEWQCQKSQKLSDFQVQNFINHDFNRSNIYLFLRKTKYVDYSYLGKLAYISHDTNKENRIYFKWQILNWNTELGNISLDDAIEKNNEVQKQLESKEREQEKEEFSAQEFTLSVQNREEHEYESVAKRKSTSESSNKNRNFEGEAKKNTSLGNAGEDIVVEYEKNYLIHMGRKDLANKVLATRKFVGNAEKYDILSFEANGEKKYIEVKTTTGELDNIFYISENEVIFSENNKDHYYLYRLYHFNKKEKTADCIIMKGALDREKLVATNYIGKIEQK